VMVVVCKWVLLLEFVLEELALLVLAFDNLVYLYFQSQNLQNL
jgi:hypothetical protein